MVSSQAITSSALPNRWLTVARIRQAADGIVSPPAGETVFPRRETERRAQTCRRCSGYAVRHHRENAGNAKLDHDRSFDSVCVGEHPRQVGRFVRRLSVLALTLALMAGKTAVCAGWLPTPEARMACCADDVECAMHKGDSHHHGSARAVTQVQADRCCASSERRNSNQSNPSAVTAITASVLGIGMVVPASIPALVLSDAWRTSAPPPVAPVPKHVLLSVFLV